MPLKSSTPSSFLVRAQYRMPRVSEVREAAAQPSFPTTKRYLLSSTPAMLRHYHRLLKQLKPSLTSFASETHTTE